MNIQYDESSHSSPETVRRVPLKAYLEPETRDRLLRAAVVSGVSLGEVIERLAERLPGRRASRARR